MDNRRYKAIGNNYVCVALNAETVTDCVRNYLASGKKKSSNSLDDEMAALLKWAQNAKVGAHLIKDEYTVIVLDADKLHDDIKERQL